MSISPLSFKGLITVKSRENGSFSTQTYKTTKKQDGELLKAASDTLQSIGYKENVYGRDTVKFQQKVEEIIGKKLESSNLGNGKFLAIGGDIDDFFHSKKYDTTYNKIFFNDDHNHFGKQTFVTVDLMEPKERQVAADVAFANVKAKIKNMFCSTKGDERLVGISKSLPEDRYAKMETVLNRTLYYLDGNIGGADFVDKAPKFGNSYQAYEELMENLLPAIGKKCYEIPYDEFRCPILSEKDYDNVSRAVYYLKSVNSDK